MSENIGVFVALRAPGRSRAGAPSPVNPQVWYEWAVTSPTTQPIHNPGGRSCDASEILSLGEGSGLRGWISKLCLEYEEQEAYQHQGAEFSVKHLGLRAPEGRENLGLWKSHHRSRYSVGK